MIICENYWNCCNWGYCDKREDLDEDGCQCSHILEVEEVVHCKDCKYLMFSDMYSECGKGIMEVVSPNDYCSRGDKK